MTIKQECIGQSFRATAPNGVVISGVIEDNPSEFKTYKILGLNVFEDNLKPVHKANVVEVVPVVVEKKGKRGSNKK